METHENPWFPVDLSRRTFSQGLEIHDAQLMAAISAAEAWQSSAYGDGSKPITLWWTNSLQWKDPPFFMGKPTISMAIFKCYVSSPGGIATLIATFILISEDNKHPSPSYFRVPRVQGCPIVLIQSRLSIWLYAYARVHLHVCKYVHI